MARMPLPVWRHPRHLGPVLEPDDQLAHHLHAAPQPLDPAEHPGPVVARRHEVRDPHGAGRGVPLLVEHQSALLVGAAGGRAAPLLGAINHRPLAGVPRRAAKQAGGVETWHAQPVDRTVPARRGQPYECRRSVRSLLCLAHPSDLRGSRGRAAQTAQIRRPEIRRPSSDRQVASHGKTRPHRAHEGADHHDEQPRQQGLMGADEERLVGVERVAAR